MSEEFGGALPSVVMQEIDTLPLGFVEQLLEYRRFAEAKAAYDRAETPEARQALKGPMVDLVQEIEFALVQAEMDDVNG